MKHSSKGSAGYDFVEDEEVRKIISDIKKLKIQGAKNVALAALKALEIYEKKHGRTYGFLELANFLQKLRETQAIKYNVIEIIKKSPDRENVYEKTRKAIEASQQRINKNVFNELFKIGKSMTIITHCRSSEEIKALIFAKERGLKINAFVTETRPRYQGLRTARELADAGIKVKYIVDSAAGLFMKHADLALFGCDAIREEGIVNKIGTYLIALAAKENDKEVFFIGDLFKTDLRKELRIEMREREEVIKVEEFKNIEILNPAFDITPWKLVSMLITDTKTCKSFEEVRKLWQERALL